MFCSWQLWEALKWDRQKKAMKNGDRCRVVGRDPSKLCVVQRKDCWTRQGFHGVQTLCCCRERERNKIGFTVSAGLVEGCGSKKEFGGTADGGGGRWAWGGTEGR